MSQHFSPRQLLARKSDVLAEKLRLFMLQNTDAKVAQLKQLARSTLRRPPRCAKPCKTISPAKSRSIST